MEHKKQSFVWGFLLVLIGGLLLVDQFLPAWSINFDWPWIVIGVGLVFLLFAVLTRTGGLAIPGSIISGIGGILYYQNITNNWETWQFAWALIPGFVGIGIALATLISPKEFNDGWQASLILLVISAVLFMIFGGSSFFGWDTQFVWPAVIILFGLFMLIRGFLRK
jgi:hypothetical protein